MITLSFPDPARRLTLNHRDHWRTRARITAAWRHATEVHARNEWGWITRFDHFVPCNVLVSFGVRDPGRRRDPHNWVSTIKPILDGLVDAGVWPDDTAEYVTVIDPTFHKGEGVTITLTPRGATDGN